MPLTRTVVAADSSDQGFLGEREDWAGHCRTAPVPRGEPVPGPTVPMSLSQPVSVSVGKDVIPHVSTHRKNGPKICESVTIIFCNIANHLMYCMYL